MPHPEIIGYTNIDLISKSFPRNDVNDAFHLFRITGGRHPINRYSRNIFGCELLQFAGTRFLSIDSKFRRSATNHSDLIAIYSKTWNMHQQHIQIENLFSD